MANLPPFFSLSGASSSSNDPKLLSVEQLIHDLSNPELMDNALYELSKRRDTFQDWAPLLWHSVGTIAALLQVIISVYPVLDPPTMTNAQSHRVCSALKLFQCVASHAETKMLFLRAQLPLYMYSFLNTSSKSKPFENLRLTTLGVIGALVKVDDTEVIRFLLDIETVPLCLQIMENDIEISKTVATFIMQKILLDNIGLEYMCINVDRLFALCRVLGIMVTSLAAAPSPRLLKHIIRCYLRLSYNPRACDALGRYLPDLLRDANFTSCLYDDPHTRQLLQQLLHNIFIGGNAVQGLAHQFVN